jgi:uncharacterized protein
MNRFLVLGGVFFILIATSPGSELPILSAKELSDLPADGGKEFNRLIFEKSPYLLQHAKNPVDWFPWGSLAQEKSRKEDKPIFLSIGYSSCHWCHVMEKESFSNPEVASILNQYFIPVKVDREERPDLDSIFMLATQLIQRGRGGWPNSLWLTPEGLPFFAGTYFPREDHQGRPGFKTILREISRLYREEKGRVRESANIIAAAISQQKAVLPRENSVLDLSPRSAALDDMQRTLEHLNARDRSGPKFPPHQQLLFIFRELSFKTDPDLLKQALKTLKIIAAGGIYDHVGGGFHRYSTDGRWFLPHFEKMLYDNAQLGEVYAHAFRMTGEKVFEQVARETLDFILREMQAPKGGFYSAYDADSEGEEGKFYLWELKEIRDLLGKKQGLEFASLFRLKDSGNFAPEVGAKSSLNHLSLKELTLRSKSIRKALSKLEKIRKKRVHPLLDDKILVDWNGLMIRALAVAGKVFKDERYLEAASQAANRILSSMVRKKRLYHNSRQGRVGVRAYLSDYSNLIAGLLELFASTRDSRWLDEAQGLTDTVLEYYLDSAHGGFYFTASDHEKLLVRQKAQGDNVTPSPAGVMTKNLLRVYDATKKTKYLTAARNSLQYYFQDISDSPLTSLSLIRGLAHFLNLSPGNPKPSSRPEFLLEKHPLAIRAKAEPKQSLILMDLQLKPGWHINSSKPHQDYLIATKVEALPERGYKFLSVNYPQGKNIEVDFSDESLSVYEGKIKIKIPYEHAGKSSSPLSFYLHTQACSETECLAPEKHLIEVSLSQ